MENGTNTPHTVTQFFYTKNLSFPCRVAGLFVSKSNREFELHSQGCHLLCERSSQQARQMSVLQRGDWVLVEMEKTQDGYRLKSWRKWPGVSTLEFHSTAIQAMENWNDFLTSVKTFFSTRGVMQVETPSLVECPGTEPHLIPFKTEQVFPDGKKQNRFLPTSPEMHLKKLLCCGWTDIFEIKKCFRNGEFSSAHQPEFYMLEWYRTFFSLKQLAQELEALLGHLSRESFFKGCLKPVETWTVSGLFLKHLDFKLTPETKKEELIRLLDKNQVPFSPRGSWEELFHLLFLNKIEPCFSEETPLIITNYPLCLRGFSQKNKQAWADRFELYWRGFELANAFYEVTDPSEQAQLFQSHLQQRSDAIPLDEELLHLMKTRGMPPGSGVALGLDRLFAALCLEKNSSFYRLFGQSGKDGKSNVKNTLSHSQEFFSSCVTVS